MKQQVTTKKSLLKLMPLLMSVFYCFYRKRHHHGSKSGRHSHRDTNGNRAELDKSKNVSFAEAENGKYHVK